ncbi:bacterioferritin [Bdellovibrionota bacterium FG-1]
MRGNDKVIASLNELLADELTAINQYMVHSEMCANWGYNRLHKIIEKRAIQEMKHAEAIIGRILFLEGKPVVSRLKELHIGEDVKTQLESDVKAEYDAVRLYNSAIKLTLELSDDGTRELFTSNLKDEESHIDCLEAQLDQIKQTGIQNYLAAQIKEEE